MKIAVIAVSRAGLEKAYLLAGQMPLETIYVPPRFIESGGMAAHSRVKFEGSGSDDHLLNSRDRVREAVPDLPLSPLEGGFAAAVGEIFYKYEALIFFSAVAVAVRGIAPYLCGKDRDPAVVAVDEGGRFAVSLLAGHLGGANELAKRIALVLGAIPVVTTATDTRGLPAFDDMARRWGWQLENLPDLKNISAALLEDREIFLYSEQPFELPLEGTILQTCKTEDLQRAVHGAVIVSNRLEAMKPPAGVPWIILRPRNVAAGIGCRRGVDAETITRAVKEALRRAGRTEDSLCCLASGEFKADEAGLIEAAQTLAVPLKIYTRREILAASGDSETSAFVIQQVGVGAVAEPCAVLGSGCGRIILPVQKGGGITVALAEGDLIRCC